MRLRVLFENRAGSCSTIYDKIFFDGVVAGEFFAYLLAVERVLAEDENMTRAWDYLHATGLGICLLAILERTKSRLNVFIPQPIGRHEQHNSSPISFLSVCICG